MAKKPVKTSKPRTRKTAIKKPVVKITKQNAVLALLRRQNGASILEIVEATDWQPHSVRGFMSGALKKRLKIDVVSEKNEDDQRRYYIAPLKA